MVSGRSIANAAAAVANASSFVKLTDAELIERFNTLFGERTPMIINAFEQRTQKASPIDLWSRNAASAMRAAAIKQAWLECAQGALMSESVNGPNAAEQQSIADSSICTSLQKNRMEYSQSTSWRIFIWHS
jgi:hypothetical protein